MTDRERRRRRAMRRRQRQIKANAQKIFLMQMVIVFLVSIMALRNINLKAEETSARYDAQVEHESVEKTMQNLDYQVTTQASTEVIEASNEVEVEVEVEVEYYPEFTYSKDWDADDSYLLAKIAMAEAEGENIQTKTLVIMTVLNRVWSDEFPDTIYDVIYQKVNGTYQFSPIGDGRWDRVEPNEECWEAVEVVMTAKYDYSDGALYFENCDGESWHSKNLEFLYSSQSVNFYK